MIPSQVAHIYLLDNSLSGIDFGDLNSIIKVKTSLQMVILPSNEIFHKQIYRYSQDMHGYIIMTGLRRLDFGDIDLSVNV